MGYFKNATKPAPGPGFEDGTPLLLANPCTASERATSAGYTFWYRRRRGDLDLSVWLGPEQAGDADFSADIEMKWSVHCQNVSVVSAHQRHGIATSMYVLAERVMGLPMTNLWEGDPRQSEEAQGLWAQPNRPFGHAPARG